MGNFLLFQKETMSAIIAAIFLNCSLSSLLSGPIHLAPSPLLPKVLAMLFRPLFADAAIR
jgi:hypothetical protein